MEYIKKPIVVEAIQFKEIDTLSHQHVNFGVPKEEGDTTQHPLDGKYWVETKQGPVRVDEGDFIITTKDGEHYPCKPDVFHANYDAVPEVSPAA